MTGLWFTDPDSSGEVLLTWRDECWYVESPDTDSEVKCLLQGDTTLNPDDSPERVSGTASKYIRGSGDRPDYLYLRPTGSQNSPTNDSEPVVTGQSHSESQSSRPQYDLADFTGSGDSVTVEALIDSVFWVKKQTDDVPDLKGALTDDSVSESVTFVVNDNVSHPYLAEGTRFEFAGVKDHYYSKSDEVQVMITEHTEFNKTGSTDQASSTKSVSPRSSGRSSSNQGSTRRRKSGSNAELDEIVADKIGDEEFTITQEDRESAIGKAKKRARNQQRDPAIDPKLQTDENSEE